jgi:hypothetical protein
VATVNLLRCRARAMIAAVTGTELEVVTDGVVTLRPVL